MKKKICLILVFVMACTALVACNPFCKHTYGAWETIKEANCHNDGLEVRRCEDCSKTDRHTVPKKIHHRQIIRYEENNCLRCRYYVECSLCLETEYVIADEKAYGNHVYNANNVCRFCDDIYEPTPDEYFLFRELSDGTYKIEAKNIYDMPQELVLPNTYKGVPVTLIDSRAFSNCDTVTSVNMGNNIKQIDYYAFNGCDNLTSVTIPHGVNTVGERAFENCSSLSDVTIRNGVAVLDVFAFNGCEALTDIAIPDSVHTIGEMCFLDAGLKSVSIGAGVSKISQNAFSGCVSLTDISVSSANGNYAVMGGMLYSNYGKTLFMCPKGAKNEIIIPDSVEEIGYGAFKECEGIESVIISDSVKTISAQAFYNCSALKSVTIGKNVEKIGAHAFKGCDNLFTVFFINPKGWKNQYYDYTTRGAEKMLSEPRSAAVRLLREAETAWFRE